MKIDTHIENLEKRIEFLNQKIRDSFLHHDRDEEICKMKRQKLLIKDELQQLMNKIDSLRFE